MSEPKKGFETEESLMDKMMRPREKGGGERTDTRSLDDAGLVGFGGIAVATTIGKALHHGCCCKERKKMKKKQKNQSAQLLLFSFPASKRMLLILPLPQKQFCPRSNGSCISTSDGTPPSKYF